MARWWQRVLVGGVLAFLLSGCTLPWQKPVSGIKVQLTDGGTAQVFLDDLHLGQTPVSVEDRKPGTYKLRIVPDAADKEPYETQVHLYPQSATTILWSFAGDEPGGTGDILELEPLASSRAELSVITVPEGATVALNTTPYGLSPILLDEVSPGDYNLTIHAVGHLKKTLSVRTQEKFRLHVFSRLESDSQTPTAPPTATASPSPSPTPSGPTPRLTATPQPSATPKASSSAALKPSATAPPKPYVKIKPTDTGWLRVRATPSGEEVAKVDVGTMHPYKSTVNGWFEIEYEVGATGWISGQYAELFR